MSKKKASPIAVQEGTPLPQVLTLRKEAVQMFGKATHRLFPSSTFDKLWLRVLFPHLFHRGKDYLTEGEGSRLSELFGERGVEVRVGE